MEAIPQFTLGAAVTCPIQLLFFGVSHCKLHHPCEMLCAYLHPVIQAAKGPHPGGAKTAEA